jgi:hypothetical protein
MMWNEFCLADPPFGFGRTAQELEATIEAKPPGQQPAADPTVLPLADGPGNPTGRNQHSDRNGCDTTNPSKRQQRGAEYLVRCLKRDDPQIAAALARGEYPSARAAGADAATPYKLPTTA